MIFEPNGPAPVGSSNSSSRGAVKVAATALMFGVIAGPLAAAAPASAQLKTEPAPPTRPNGTIIACYDRGDHSLRLVTRDEWDARTSPQLCTANERRIVWGSEGAEGQRGKKGDTGAKGEKGDTGAAGDIGVTGAQGVAGAMGPQGPQGVAGATGAQGPVGVTGPAGIDGVAGPPGVAGPIGPEGPGGPQGVAGPDGAVGSIGPQGSIGATGLTGADGATGATGATGLTGADGATGPQGPPGQTGATGPQGPAGSAAAVVYRSVTTNSLTTGTLAAVTASCQPGEVAIGGGWDGTHHGNNMYAYDSHPSEANGTVDTTSPTSWTVWALAENPQSAAFTTYVVCAPTS